MYSLLNCGLNTDKVPKDILWEVPKKKREFQ